MGEKQSSNQWPSKEDIRRDPHRPANPGRDGQGGYGGQVGEGRERKAEGEERRQGVPSPGEQEGGGPIRREE